MQTDISKKDIELLNKAADCIDDCLVIIYPEEFDDWQVVEAQNRFFKSKGIINRTATVADALRALAERSRKNK